jgi:hypothetical protein
MTTSRAYRLIVLFFSEQLNPNSMENDEEKNFIEFAKEIIEKSKKLNIENLPFTMGEFDETEMESTKYELTDDEKRLFIMLQELWKNVQDIDIVSRNLRAIEREELSPEQKTRVMKKEACRMLLEASIRDRIPNNIFQPSGEFGVIKDWKIVRYLTEWE